MKRTLYSRHRCYELRLYRANDGVAGGGGACDFVGFVFASDLLFFVFL
jgi:hypothetical protein